MTPDLAAIHRRWLDADPYWLLGSGPGRQLVGDILDLADVQAERLARAHTGHKYTHGITGEVTYCCPAHQDGYEWLDQARADAAEQRGRAERLTQDNERLAVIAEAAGRLIQADTDWIASGLNRKGAQVADQAAKDLRAALAPPEPAS